MKVEKGNTILKGLNEKQIEAVTWGDGPLLIVAGAGTGKTKVITHRIAWLIFSKKALPEEILALTFTEKAAQEMEERVTELLPYTTIAPITITTFHSFGKKILEEYSFEVGIPGFKVIGEEEVLVFLRELMWEEKLTFNYFRPLGNPFKYLTGFIEFISRAKDEDITPEEYLNYGRKLEEKATSPEEKEEAQKTIEIGEWYKTYNEKLHQKGYVDIGDLIVLPLKLLREKKNVVKEINKRYKYILVDEFQDTNYAQFELLKLVVGEQKNITVVGDDDQSIYKFRGACLSNILTFTKVYPTVHTVVLTQNYRSKQQILDQARKLILHNNPYRLEVKIGVNKELVSSSPSCSVGQANLFSPSLHVKFYDTASTEADEIASLIKKKLASENYTYNDFAILLRKNKLAKEFIRALNMENIPWKFSGEDNLLEKKIVKILISVLELLNDVNSPLHFYHLLQWELFKVEPEIISTALGISKRMNRSLYWVIKNKIVRTPKIERILKIIDSLLHTSLKEDAGRVLYLFLEKSGWRKYISTNPTIEKEIEAQYVVQFFSFLEKIITTLGKSEVPTVVDYLHSLIEHNITLPSPTTWELLEGVNILTVHKAKGLEFKVVFLAGLTEDIFPSQSRAKLITLPVELIKEEIPPLEEREVRIQEERRLFYVGMTRAKEELYLTGAKFYNGKREKKLSRFVYEALDVTKERIPLIIGSTHQKIESFKPSFHTFKKSDSLKLELQVTLIDEYLKCPKRYWFIKNVPREKRYTLIYGTVLHKTIADYLRSKKKGESPSLEWFYSVYERNWKNEGFIHPTHERQMFLQGKKVLAQFFKQEEKKTTPPIEVEFSFHFMVNGVKISGRLDRIDEEEGDIIITDYKTGEKKEDSAKYDLRKSTQLPIYAWGYSERYHKFPQKIVLHYLESNFSVEVEGEKLKERVEEVKEKVATVIQGLREGNFNPIPGYECRWCDFRGICEEGEEL